MSKREYPGFAYMASREPPVVVMRRHLSNLSFYDAVLSDCWIEGMREVVEPKDGFHSHFQCHFSNYRGWKVYMLMTGALASGTEEEEEKLELENKERWIRRGMMVEKIRDTHPEFQGLVDSAPAGHLADWLEENNYTDLADYVRRVDNKYILYEAFGLWETKTKFPTKNN